MVDGRVKYTKMVIRTAFMKLLDEHPVDKITVTGICELAGINRATFYRYYSDQYELLSVLENEMLMEIQKIAEKDASNVDALVLLIYQKFYEKRDEWTLLLGKNGDSRLLSKVHAYFDKFFSAQELFKSEDIRMRYRFLLYGCSGLFTEWAENGFLESPEKMAEYTNRYRHEMINDKRK